MEFRITDTCTNNLAELTSQHQQAVQSPAFDLRSYFLESRGSCKAVKMTLKAEINEEMWESLYGNTLRPFKKPKSGWIAVKVIN